MATTPDVTDILLKKESKELTSLTRDYQTVRLRSLFPGTTLPCDFFLPGKREENESLRMAKFLTCGDEYSADLHEYLTAQGIDSVFIRQDKEEAYLAYISDYLHKNLLSSSLPPEQKAAIVYDNAEVVVKKVFREKPNRDNVALGKQLSNQMAALLTRDNVSLEALFGLYSKDYKTFNHCVQVAILGMSFGRFLGWNAEEVADFGLGALFHDVGKNSIEDAILKKPGKLEKDEFELMKKHPLLGFHQLKKADVMSADQLKVVLNHHEALDGSGYPQGLKGEEIHKYARVGRIVDVFDALISRRSYKDAVSRDEALRIMSGDMRSGFDGSLLEQFARFLNLDRSIVRVHHGVRINIELGGLVQLQIEGEDVRFKAILVGMECDKYLILRVAGLKGFKKTLAEGVETVGRYVHSGAVYGFRTIVLACIQYPMPLLFLAYPESVENINLRREERIDCVLPAEVLLGDIVVAGAILDISGNGCKLALKAADGADIPSRPLHSDIVIKAQFAPKSEFEKFTGKVRNIKMDNDRILLGIQFTDIPSETTKFLSTYIRSILSLVK